MMVIECEEYNNIKFEPEGHLIFNLQCSECQQLYLSVYYVHNNMCIIYNIIMCSVCVCVRNDRWLSIQDVGLITS